MNRRRFLVCAVTTVLVSSLAICPADAHDAGLKHSTLVLIRHADKPDNGDGLSPAGEARARAYVGYFQNFTYHSEPVKFDAIFAAADSRASHRPRLTITPTASALGLPINANYKDKDYQGLVNEIYAHHEGKHLLICWHHGEMPDLLRALGADPDTLLPNGRWPEDQYDWVVVLHYDHDGHLKDAEKIEAGLTPH